MDVPDSNQLQIVALKASGGLRRLKLLWLTVRQADIVQPGTAYWPTGWLACWMAALQKTVVVIIVESAPWRSVTLARDGLKRKTFALIRERIVRYFVNAANIRLYTHIGYRTSLAAENASGLVIPASWIDAEDIVPLSVASETWARKVRDEPVKFLFVGRLTEDKGVLVLLEAIDRLRSRGVVGRVDIIGEGPLKDACMRSAAAPGSLVVRVLDTVPYGPPFFALLQRYFAVVVPSLGDEQPRILFDCYAQAIPVIASATEGIRSTAEADATWLTTPGNADELAEVIEARLREPAILAEAGLRGPHATHRFTHEATHRARIAYIRENLPRR